MTEIWHIAITLVLLAVVIAYVKAGEEKQKKRWQRISKKCDGQGKDSVCDWNYCFDIDMICYELEKLRTNRMDKFTRPRYDHVMRIVDQALSTYTQSVAVPHTLETPHRRRALAAAYRLKTPEKIIDVLKLWASNRPKPFPVPVNDLPKTNELYFVDFYTVDGNKYRGFFGETDEGKGWTAGAFSHIPNNQIQQKCTKAGQRKLCTELVFLPEVMNYTPILKDALENHESGVEPIHILKLRRLLQPDTAIPVIMKREGQVGEHAGLKELYYVVFLAKDGAYQGSFAKTKEGRIYLSEPITKVLTDEAKLAETRELLLKKDYADVFWLWRKITIKSRFLPHPHPKL